MKLNKHIFLYSFAVIITIMVFTTCKKYPDNTIWFKNPKNIPVIEGYITSYVVNGIDSLNFLNAYYSAVIPNSRPPYTNTQRDIKKEHFSSRYEKYFYWEVNSNLLYERLNYKMDRNKKTVRIGGSVDTLYYKKQLFLSKNADINWDIQYLDKYGKKAKIKTNYNGIDYEITFEN